MVSAHCARQALLSLKVKKNHRKKSWKTMFAFKTEPIKNECALVFLFFFVNGNVILVINSELLFWFLQIRVMFSSTAHHHLNWMPEPAETNCYQHSVENKPRKKMSSVPSSELEQFKRHGNQFNSRWGVINLCCFFLDFSLFRFNLIASIYLFSLFSVFW